MPAPGLLAGEQRHQDAERAIDAGGQVGDGDADAHRPLPRLARDRHEAAHSLRDLIEAGPLLVGTVLPEAGDAGIDEARIEGGEALVIDAEPVLHVRPEILDQHVGLLDEALEHGAPFGRLQVQGEAALVAMQILEVDPVPRAAGRIRALERRRRLDLEDVRAPIGELPNGRRAGADPRQIEHEKARQSPRCRLKRHWFSLPVL